MIASLVVFVGIVVAVTGDDEDASITTTDDPAATEASSSTAPSTDAATTEVATTAPETTVAETDVLTTSTDAPTTVPTTTEPTPPSTDAPPSSVVPPADPRCNYLGVDSVGDMQVEVEFVNPLGAVPAVDVAFALVDDAGVRFHTDFGSFDLPRADEWFRVEVDTVTELPGDVDGDGVTCQVLDIEEGFGFDDVEPPADTSSCRIDGVDSFDDIQITLSVTSPFDTTEDLLVFYALRTVDGTRFDDSFAGVDLVGPGEAVRVAEDTLTERPDWVGAGDLACDVLGIATSDF